MGMRAQFSTCLLSGVSQGLHPGLDRVYRKHEDVLPHASRCAGEHVLQAWKGHTVSRPGPWYWVAAGLGANSPPEKSSHHSSPNRHLSWLSSRDPPCRQAAVLSRQWHFQIGLPGSKAAPYNAKPVPYLHLHSTPITPANPAFVAPCLTCAHPSRSCILLWVATGALGRATLAIPPLWCVA